MSSQTLVHREWEKERKEGRWQGSCIIQSAPSTPPGLLINKGDAQERTSRLTHLPRSLSLLSCFQPPAPPCFVHCHQHPPTTTCSTPTPCITSISLLVISAWQKTHKNGEVEDGGGQRGSFMNRKHLVSTHKHTHARAHARTHAYQKRLPLMNCAVCCCSNWATLPLMPLTFWIWGPWSFHPTSLRLFFSLSDRLPLSYIITHS